MLEATETYDLDGPKDFSDHVIPPMNQAFLSKVPHTPAEFIPTRGKRPMEGLLRFIAGLAEANTPETQRIRGAQELDSLSPKGRKILPFLPLPKAEIAERADIPLKSLPGVIRTARKHLGAKSRVDFALVAYERGVRLEVVEPPPLSEFTLRERQVATRLPMENPEIARDIGASKQQVARSVCSLLAKIGARTRAEVAIIARIQSCCVECQNQGRMS